MRNFVLIAVFAFTLAHNACSQDSTRFFRVGFIPYQFFSRSTGLYAGIDYKNFGIELRPTYTIATYAVPWWYLDWFYYQGVNTNLILYFDANKKDRVGLIVGYKYWWYSKQDVLDEHHNGLMKSSYMLGPTFGIEGIFGFSRKKFDRAFFTDLTVTIFSRATTTYKDVRMGIFQTTKEVIPVLMKVNFVVGFKLGWRKRRR